ncbi:DUF2142 domain-containing protein [Candidatus Roizmanbacteria bacterium]|nr:DUF2142 domain-containing protein [Candidatus Roizmanbacteria bacterium]
MSLTAKIVFLYIFILGLAFTFVVPPLQKPDEHGHFIRTILLSHGKIFLTNKDGVLPIEKQYYELVHDPLLNKIPYHPRIKFYTRWYIRSPFADKDAYKLVNESTWGQFMLPATSYIPYAVGISIARLFQLNAYLTFFMGRLSMFLLAFVWMIFLYKKIPQAFKPILLFVFSLPMLIHQITGYNYDAMQCMMGFSLFVLILNLLQKRKLSLPELTALGGTFLLFLIMKLSFEPMLLLIFLIPYKKIAGSFSQYVKKIIFVLVILLAGYFLIKSTFFISASRYSHHPKGVNPAQQVQYILNHPINYLQNFMQSSLRLSKFHLQGLIGIFGWLDYSMAWWVYVLYLFASIYLICSINLEKSERMNPWQIMLILGSVFLTYSFMLTIFYLNWKTVGSPVIDGTQGRYFISLLPFILLGFVQLRWCSPKWILPKWMKIVLVFVLFLLIVSIINSIQTRYY